MQIEFRPARTDDFQYCKRLYWDGMSALIEELHLDMAAQVSGFSRQWSLDQDDRKFYMRHDPERYSR